MPKGIYHNDTKYYKKYVIEYAEGYLGPAALNCCTRNLFCFHHYNLLKYKHKF